MEFEYGELLEVEPAIREIIKNDDEGDMLYLGQDTEEDLPSTTSNTGSSSSKRKRPFRFNIQANIDLLKEVINVEPYKAEFGQVKASRERVAANCQQGYDGDRAQKKYQEMMNLFKSKSTAQLKKSGTAEQYSDLDQLLQDIGDRIEAWKAAKPAEKKKNASDVAKAQSVRDDALKKLAMKKRKERESEDAQIVKEASLVGQVKVAKSPGTGTRGSQKPDNGSSSNFEQLLSQHLELRNRELAIKERKMALEERKMALEETKWGKKAKPERNSVPNNLDQSDDEQSESE